MPQARETLLPHASASLNKLFEADLPARTANISYDQLLQLLSRRIKHMMQHDHQRLLNIFYRIDLNEEKVAAAFNLSSMAEVAGKLAQLVIERELQKVQLRLKYSSSRN